MATDIDLDALQKLANEATPGPWVEGGEGGRDWETGSYDWVWWVQSHGFEPHVAPVVCQLGDDDQSESDTKFIAAARTAVPALIAHARSLESQLATAEQEAAESTEVASELRAEFRDLRSQLADKSALTDEQVDLISDALTGLWNRAPQRRAEIERLCISQRWLIEGEGPDD